MTRTKSQIGPIPPDHGIGLIPPAELWGRVLTTGSRPIDAHLPFDERVERAWRRLKAGFHEDEHERLPGALATTLTREFRKEGTT